MPFSALAETTQVRHNLSTLAAGEVAFPALEQMRERWQQFAYYTLNIHICIIKLKKISWLYIVQFLFKRNKILK